MEIVFAVTHFVMVICTVSITWLGLNSRGGDENTIEKSLS
jgi:hypothetical protein